MVEDNRNGHKVARFRECTWSHRKRPFTNGESPRRSAKSDQSRTYNCGLKAAMDSTPLTVHAPSWKGLGIG
jgi:hypothetical protein